MRARDRGRFGRSPSPPPFIVLDAAVLFEAGWDALCDEVWTVSTEPERALERLVARNRLAPEAARARIEAQLGNAEREARADRVLRNDGTLDALDAAVDALAGAVRCGGACERSRVSPATLDPASESPISRRATEQENR